MADSTSETTNEFLWIGRLDLIVLAADTDATSQTLADMASLAKSNGCSLHTEALFSVPTEIRNGWIVPQTVGCSPPASRLVFHDRHFLYGFPLPDALTRTGGL